MMTDSGSEMDSSRVENVGAVGGNVPTILPDLSTRTQSITSSMSAEDNEKDERIAELEHIASDRLAYIKKLEKEISEKDVLIARLNVENDIRQAVETEKVKEKVNEKSRNDNEKADSERVRDRAGKENEKLQEDAVRLKGEIGVLETALDKEKKASRARTKGLKLWRLTCIFLAILTVILCGILFTKMNCKECTNVQPYIDVIDTLKTNITHMKSEVEKVKSEKVKITIELNDYKVETTMMKGRNSDLEREKKEIVSKLGDLEGTKTSLEKELGTLKAELSDIEKGRNNIAQKVKALELDIKEKEIAKEKLELDIDGLQTRLSECQTANDEDSISESELSPIKLGQLHRSIYEQDYTMAVDELEEKQGTLQTKETVQLFLDILKTAYKYTENITTEHIESMKKTVLSINVDLPVTEQQVTVPSLSVKGSLSKMDWKDFYGIRQKCAWRMRDSVAQELGTVIARQYGIDSNSQPKMMTYIRACIDLCWKAHIHREPVYLDFYEPETSTTFDSTVYKAFMYLKGDNFDYLVWPPIYERNGGSMIAKGIAERKD